MSGRDYLESFRGSISRKTSRVSASDELERDDRTQKAVTPPPRAKKSRAASPPPSPPHLDLSSIPQFSLNSEQIPLTPRAASVPTGRVPPSSALSFAEALAGAGTASVSRSRHALGAKIIFSMTPEEEKAAKAAEERAREDQLLLDTLNSLAVGPHEREDALRDSTPSPSNY